MENSQEDMLRERVEHLERVSRRWKRMTTTLGLVGAVVLLMLTAIGVTWCFAPDVAEADQPSPGSKAPQAAEPEEQASEVFQPKRMGRPQSPITKVPVLWISSNPKVLKPSEMVLGVVVGGESRAYPLNMLTGPDRELINDTLGGQPILTSWCPLCHEAVVHSRILDGKTLEFYVSGQLWNENMVMTDLETGSLWSQMLGEAMSGPLKGKVLGQVPSVLTDWQSWSAAHPDGSVVSMPRAEVLYDRDYYRDRKEFVLGIASSDQAKAWTFEALGRTPVIPTRCEGRWVVVVFDPTSVTARVFARTVNDRLLSFEWDDGHLTDRETGSRWDSVSGRALSGPLIGQSLEMLPTSVTKRETWLAFHPRSEINGETPPARTEPERATGNDAKSPR